MGSPARPGAGWNCWRNESGLSLVEMLLTLSLLVVVVAAFSLFQSQGIRLYTLGRDNADLEYNLRAGLDRVEREMRAAKDVAISDGGTRVTYTDTNGDRAVLYWDPATQELRRVVTGLSPQVLAADITSASFGMVAGQAPLVAVSLTGTRGAFQREAFSLVAVRAP